MKNLLVIFLVTCCNCQDYSLPSRYVYADNEDINEKQIQFFKATRRSDDRITSQPIQYSTREENYPKSARTEIPSEDYVIRRIAKSRREKLPSPVVEQYLKEVTPTTKVHRSQKQKEIIRRQPQLHYINLPQEQQEVQQQKLLVTNTQPSYDALNDNIRMHKDSQEVLQKNLIRFRDILLSQYNALAGQQKQENYDNQDTDSRSAIYVHQTLPKKKIRKITKQKTHPYEQEVDLYAQQNLQQQSQNVPQISQVYEKKEPAPAKFQAKLPEYQSEDYADVKDQQDVVFQPQHDDYQQISIGQGKRQRLEIPRPDYHLQVQEQEDATQYQRQPAIKYEKITPDDAIISRQPVNAEQYRQIILANAAKYQSQAEEVTRYEQPNARYIHQKNGGHQQTTDTADNNERTNTDLANQVAILRQRAILSRFQQPENLSAMQSHTKQSVTDAFQLGDRYLQYSDESKDISQNYKYVENNAPEFEDKIRGSSTRSRTFPTHSRHRSPSSDRYHLRMPVRHVVYTRE